MKNKLFSNIKKIIFVALAAVFIFLGSRNTAHAGYPVTVIAETSPTAIQRTVDSIMMKLKSFTLDKIATAVAKQILHQMTVSVINWINTGFEGSPAFITNPKGFFLDVGDQLTGAFLADGGPLTALCSPFSLDIRLSLALQTSGFVDKRYTCTLGTIINNGKNAVQNATANGFLSGDFHQGGWPAFIAVNTQPQNNAVGAYLRAENDLLSKITGKQELIKADVAMGRGFASWKKCTDVSSTVANGGMIDGTSYNDMGKLYEFKSQTVNVGTTRYGESIDVESKLSKDGKTLTYQKCETQTPGSVIADTLQKQLNVPAEELELANDINAVINALVTQLISQMLNGGLRALSGSSGGQTSYTSQVIQQSIAPNIQIRDNLQSSIRQTINTIKTYYDKYVQAEGMMIFSQRQLEAAKACFKTKIDQMQNNYDSTSNRAFYLAQMSAIDAMITNRVTPVLSKLTESKNKIKFSIDELEVLASDDSGDATKVKAAADKYTKYIEQGEFVKLTNSDQADNDYNDAKTQSEAFNAEALKYLNQCSGVYTNR
jgi:hypothetical protein